MTQRAGTQPAQALRVVNGLTKRRETVSVPHGSVVAVVREAADDPILAARIATVAGVLVRAISLFAPLARVRDVAPEQARPAAQVLWVGANPPDPALRAIWLKVGAVEVAPDDADEMEADDPALAYAFLGAHYSSPLSLDLESLDAGEAALERLEQRVSTLRQSRSTPNPAQVAHVSNTFNIALADDLNTPTALAVIWQMLLLAQDNEINPAGKLAVLALADKTLALGLDIEETLPVAPPQNRRAWDSAPSPDKKTDIRGWNSLPSLDKKPQNKQAGNAPLPDKKPQPAPKPLPGTGGAHVTSSRDVRSMLSLPDLYAFSLIVVARNSLQNVRACVESVVAVAKAKLRTNETGGGKQGMIEVVLVDLGSQDGSAGYADDLAHDYGFVRTILAERDLGAAAGYNIGLKQSRGRIVVLLDPAYTLTGDIWTPLNKALLDEQVGAVGAVGLKITTRDVRTGALDIEPVDAGDADALRGDLIAFRRARVETVGLMDEKFRVARYLDLDYSQNFREAELALRVLPELRDAITRNEAVALGGRAGLSIGSAGDSRDDVDAATQAEREKRNARQFLNRV